MSIDFDGVSYLFVAQAVRPGVPITMAYFLNPDVCSAPAQCDIGICCEASSVDYFWVGHQDGDYATSYDPFIWVRSAAANEMVYAGCGLTPGIWSHIGGVFAAINNRKIYVNGVLENSGVVSITPANLNTTAIGTLKHTNPTSYRTKGLIAEAAIWNVALPAWCMEQLAAGMSPLLVAREYLVAYWPLIGINALNQCVELINGVDVGKVGSPISGSHCRVFRPSVPHLGRGRISGYYNIYRGQDGIMDYEHVQAVMKLEDNQITIPNQILPPLTRWNYIRRQVSACGLESPDSPACIVRINGAGDMVGQTPNPPLNLAIEGVAGGKLKLRWRYTPIAEETRPTGFKIYMDSGSGFDFGTPQAIVEYGLGGTGEFNWTSDALTDGQLYRFCVRSYYEAGGESRNSSFVAAVADSTGPNAIVGLRASWQEN